MAKVSVERVPVQVLGLGVIGFDHLQIVLQTEGTGQESWFVIEGLREPDGAGVRLAVEGWHGGTTLSDANGGLAGAALVQRIGTSASRGARVLAEGGEAVSLWATLVSYAADIEAQRFPYIPAALPGSPLPTLNSSSLVASLLYHAGVDAAAAMPLGLRFSPGVTTLLGTSAADTISLPAGFTTLVGGDGDDRLSGSDTVGQVDKLFGGRGDDTFHWSRGHNILHGGQPGLAAADDGSDTVDYSGAGLIRIETPPGGGFRAQPDFIVTHAFGQDHLYSIEAVIWDGARDRVSLGKGVGLLPGAAGAGLAPQRAEALPALVTSEGLSAEPQLPELPDLGPADVPATFAGFGFDPFGPGWDGLSAPADTAVLDPLPGG